jgi:hypothetical protein
MKYKNTELVPITKVQAFEEPREMLVWNNPGGASLQEREVIGILIDNSKIRVAVIAIGGIVYFDYCAEIPQPTTRKMNALEVMEYLHRLQMVINKQNGCLREIPSVIYGDEFDFGLVVCKTGGEWFHFAQFREVHNPGGFKFGILKNGKVTEFELPKVEA